MLALRVCRGRGGGGADIVIGHGRGVFLDTGVGSGGGGHVRWAFISPQQLFGLLSFFDFFLHLVVFLAIWGLIRFAAEFGTALFS